jgi:N-acyl-D-amino-acid deacylase
MMRPWIVAIIVVATALAGCTSPAPAATGEGPEAQQFPLVLREEATPRDDVLVDSRDERRSNLRAPGFPLYAPADAAMVAFMEDQEIGAGALAVIRDGKLLYEKGYGTLDGATATPPDAMFRIASLSKTVTATVIRTLVDDGVLAWDDHVFCIPPEPSPTCILSIPIHPNRPVVDERVADVTVEDLRNHRTGWDRDSCAPDYDGKAIEVAETLGIPSPPPPWRNAQWLLGEPMKFAPGEDPGAVDGYCNLGYRILGLIAEAKAGVTLAGLESAFIFEPLDIAGDMEPGRTLPENRNPREPDYKCGDMTPNVYDPNETVCEPDGGFNVEGFLGSGGLIATAEAVATVFGAYTTDGSNWRAETNEMIMISAGSLPGTIAWTTRYITDDGEHIEVAILFNERSSLNLIGTGVQDVQFFEEQSELLRTLSGLDSSLPA